MVIAISFAAAFVAAEARRESETAMNTKQRQRREWTFMRNLLMTITPIIMQELRCSRQWKTSSGRDDKCHFGQQIEFQSVLFQKSVGTDRCATPDAAMTNVIPQG
jgi:hypothetical protein